MLEDNPLRAWYGEGHVFKAADRGAIGKLLVSDELFRCVPSLPYSRPCRRGRELTSEAQRTEHHPSRGGRGLLSWLRTSRRTVARYSCSRRCMSLDNVRLPSFLRFTPSFAHELTFLVSLTANSSLGRTTNRAEPAHGHCCDPYVSSRYRRCRKGGGGGTRTAERGGGINDLFFDYLCGRLCGIWRVS